MAPAIDGVACKNISCAHTTKICRLQGRQPLHHGNHWNGEALLMAWVNMWPCTQDHTACM